MIMGNGNCGIAAKPWYACVLLHVFSFGNNANDSSNVPQKKSQNEIVLVAHKKQSKMLTSSASACDLRFSDVNNGSLDASSPRGVLDSCFRGSESEASFKENTTQSESPSKSRALTNWSRFFKLWKKKSTKHLRTFHPLAMPKLSREKSRSTREDPDLTHIYNYRSSLKEFTLSELQTATKNFSSENLIGKGGYAEVYKGCLRDGTLVAVKRLTKGTVDEKTCGFLCEIGSKDKPDWSKRYRIALGTANGLTYLHEGCQKRIIHRDIKADNILLTEDYEPQVSALKHLTGLSLKWKGCTIMRIESHFCRFVILDLRSGCQDSGLTTTYFAPEYFMHGIVDEKTDVYSFGVLLLELITGRRAVDHLQQSVVIWAKPLLDSNDIRELVDPSLGDNYDAEEMDRAVLTASLCIEQSPILRPKMSQVVILLRGDEDNAQSVKESQKQTHRRTYSEELFDAQEYNSTRYLSDISRFKEIALGS
ncbi:Receptor-like cytosolic serine/threonine-protein kinase RBK2 [Citrus sinensis]|uniref:Receptor-like cytosolic serine/threonine-protein kinase RBK2 n=1 Tax=Citrus sinensis TaxID=2711 RepID=A0ACB8KKI7_CITSI|nr:Receptor-like cytosolic serine/threonine-protein kinase RBK2 [Citrus sinensis]